MKRNTTRYVAILEGEGPGTSRPILATSDKDTVDAVLELIKRRLGEAVQDSLPLVFEDGEEGADS